MPFYAVKKGRVPGLYTTWSECDAQVKGFSGGVYQKFATEKQAQEWLDGTIESSEPTQLKPGTVRLITDGACSGNPGPGGAAALIRSSSSYEEVTRAFRLTTNNRMELVAAIIGLEAILEGMIVELVSDSRYVLSGLAAPHKQQKNIDLWQRLIARTSTRTVTTEWVEGHADHADNNRADNLAVGARTNGPWEEDEGYVGRET